MITGLSGSGKSSLAFDTLYAEGQRRYVESLSSYARQFLGLMEKPDVDSIEGLSPAISIDQKTTSRNPRSTVGTVTEIYDYLRLLWARIGNPHCFNCGEPIQGQSLEQITDRVLALEEGTRFMVLAPSSATARASTGGCSTRCARRATPAPWSTASSAASTRRSTLDKKFKHDISIVVDRLVMKEGVRKRLAESIEAASQLADGLIEMELDGKAAYVTDGDEAPGPPCSVVRRGQARRGAVFSERFACLNCGASMPEIEPRIFSFNSPHGACQRCHGLGFQRVIDPELIVPDPTLSISEGALEPWTQGRVDVPPPAARGGRRVQRHRRHDAVAGPHEARARPAAGGHRRRASTRSPTRTASGAGAPTRCASRACSLASSAATRTPTPRTRASGSRS